MILNKDTVDFTGERLIAFSKRRNRTKMFLLMTPIQHDKGRASQCKRKENTMHIDWKEKSKIKFNLNKSKKNC